MAILGATRTHDVILWFCGLASADLHVSRVQARVAAGGHDIPEPKMPWPSPADALALAATPAWATPLVEAALSG